MSQNTITIVYEQHLNNLIWKYVEIYYSYHKTIPVAVHSFGLSALTDIVNGLYL